MKRAAKTVLWTALIFIGVGITFLLVGLLATKGDFSKIATVRYENRQRTVEEDFTDISIEQYAGNVYLYPTSEGVCRIEYMEAENILQSISVEDGVLKIAEQDNRKWYECVGIFWGTKTLTVYLPQAEYNAVKVKGGSGDVEIASGLTFSSVDVHVESGEISLSASARAQINLTAQSGDVTVKNATAANLLADAQSGSIWLENVAVSENISLGVQSGEIQANGVSCNGFAASAQSGEVELVSVLSSGITQIETQSGDVELRACDASAYRIAVQSGSVSGSILTNKIFLAKTYSGNVDVPVSTEGGVCEVTTASGDIHLWIGTGA